MSSTENEPRETSPLATGVGADQLWKLQLRKEHAALMKKIDDIPAMQKIIADLRAEGAKHELEFENLRAVVAEHERERDKQAARILAEFKKGLSEEISRLLPADEAKALSAQRKKHRDESRARSEKEISLDSREHRAGGARKSRLNATQDDFNTATHKLEEPVQENRSILPPRASKASAHNQATNQLTGNHSHKPRTAIPPTRRNDTHESEDVQYRPLDATRNNINKAMDSRISELRPDIHNRFANSTLTTSDELKSALTEQPPIDQEPAKAATRRLPKRKATKRLTTPSSITGQLKQNRRGLENYYQFANKMYYELGGTDREVASDYVHRFIQGLTAVMNQKLLTIALQEAHPFGAENGNIQIFCRWIDVLRALEDCGLVERRKVSSVATDMKRDG